MPRRARIQKVEPGHPHHLVLRGNNRRRLFSDHVSRELFLAYVDDAQRGWCCPVHALVLMTNHVHLVTTPPTVIALSRFVQSFAQRYAQRRNRLRGGSGRLFEERFYSERVRDAEHMAALVPYVELNPERAGMVARLDEHPWSTYALHAGDGASSLVPRALWTPSDWYLGLASTDAARQATYREWVTMRRGQAVWNHERIDDLERASDPYTRRLRRPDGTRAAEEVMRSYGGVAVAGENACDFEELEG